MKKKELANIEGDLAEELREMPAGSETTAIRMMEFAGYDPKEFEDPDIIEFDRFLCRIAKANRIILEPMTERQAGTGTVSPSDLRYTVHNEKARIKCPRCGSRNTARILYGMPAMNETLLAKLDAGKVHLGGCCISGAYDGRGNMIRTDPARYCNDCRREFARPPYLVGKDHRSAEAFPEIVTGIRFIYSEFFPKITIEILKNQNGADVSVLQFPETDQSAVLTISARTWKRLVDRLYTELYVQDWKREYEVCALDGEVCVLDGFHWSLEILMTDRRKRTYRGNNAYPPYWKELNSLFRPLLRRK